MKNQIRQVASVHEILEMDFSTEKVKKAQKNKDVDRKVTKSWKDHRKIKYRDS